MDYTNLDDRQLLILLASRQERMLRVMDGNGRPGLIERVATLEANPAPGKKERWGVIGAVLAGAIVTVARLFGVELVS